MRFLSPILQAFLVLLAVSIVTFGIQAAVPGDPAENRVGPRPYLSPPQRDEVVRAVRKQLGFDHPLPVQYVKWLERAVHGDFGTDLSGQDVLSTVGGRIGASLELALAAVMLSVPVAVLLALAVVRGARRRSMRVLNSVIVAGFVIPPFWLGVLLVLVFSVWRHWLPSSGYVDFQSNPLRHFEHLILPTVTLATPQIALYYRYLQQSLREALGSQYIRTAEAKGVSERRILYRHALPNALLPALTILGIQLGALIGGIVVIERVFSWPGVGTLLLYAVNRSDYNTVVFIVLTVAAAYVVISALVDVTYRLIDPRMRRA